LSCDVEVIAVDPACFKAVIWSIFWGIHDAADIVKYLPSKFKK